MWEISKTFLGGECPLFSKEGGLLPMCPPVIANVCSYQTERAADSACKWKVHMEGINRNLLYDIIERSINCQQDSTSLYSSRFHKENYRANWGSEDEIWH